MQTTIRGIEMNKAIINGKITQLNICEKVAYMTICARNKNGYEYIPVTTFNVEFLKRYFHIGKWICIEGYIHTNKYKDQYITEIIAESLNFSGDMSELDKEVERILNEATDTTNNQIA